jgi:hypothetical protein
MAIYLAIHEKSKRIRRIDLTWRPSLPNVLDVASETGGHEAAGR